jgi:hypothetical protein
LSSQIWYLSSHKAGSITGQPGHKCENLFEKITKAKRAGDMVPIAEHVTSK